MQTTTTKRRGALAVAAILSLIGGPTEANTLTWVGGASGDDWFARANWDPRIAPRAGDSVILNTGAPLLGAAASIADFSFVTGKLGGGGTLNVQGLATFGDPHYGITQVLDYATTLNLHAGASNPGAAITVNGTLNNLAGSTFTSYGWGPSSSSFNSINGSGSFNNLGAYVEAAPAGQTTYIDAVFNNGGAVTVRSGTMVLNGGGSHGGSFNVLDGATLMFNTVNGGTNSFASGTSIVNAGSLMGTGGQITLGGAGVRYSGSGALEATGGVFALRFTDAVAASVVRIRYGGTLDAGGQVATEAFAFDQGTLSGRLAVGGTATFGVAGSYVQQTLSAGARLTLNGGAKDVSLAIVVDGTLLNAAGSAFAAGGATYGGAPSDQSITGSGLFDNQGSFQRGGDNQRMTVAARFNNSGTVDVNAGALWLSGGGAHSGAFNVAPGSVLSFAGGTHRISPGSRIANEGVLSVAGGTVTLSGAAYTGTGQVLLTAGNLNIEATSAMSFAALQVDGGKLVVTGVLQAADVRVDGGEVLLFGELGAAGASMVVAGGRLRGTGTIVGHLTQEGGTIAPGSLTVEGDFEQIASVGHDERIVEVITAPAGHSLLAITGNAALAGELVITFAGYAPVVGDRFEMLTFGSRSGTFHDVVVGLGDHYRYTTTYETNAFVLTITAASPVPEPPSWLFFAVALGGAALRRCRR